MLTTCLVNKHDLLQQNLNNYVQRAKTCSTHPFFINTNVSSTYLLQCEMLPVTVVIIIVFNSIMKILARTGPKAGTHSYTVILLIYVTVKTKVYIFGTW